MSSQTFHFHANRYRRFEQAKLVVETLLLPQARTFSGLADRESRLPPQAQDDSFEPAKGSHLLTGFGLRASFGPFFGSFGKSVLFGGGGASGHRHQGSPIGWIGFHPRLRASRLALLFSSMVPCRARCEWSI